VPENHRYDHLKQKSTARIWCIPG